MTNKAIKLKPCPFCGGEAKMIYAMGEVWAHCQRCNAGTETESTTNLPKAIKHWNRRVMTLKGGGK